MFCSFFFSILCLFGAYLLGGSLYRYFSLGIRGIEVWFSLTSLHMSLFFLLIYWFYQNWNVHTGNPKFWFLGHCTSQNTGIVLCFYILSTCCILNLRIYNAIGLLCFSSSCRAVLVHYFRDLGVQVMATNKPPIRGSTSEQSPESSMTQQIFEVVCIGSLKKQKNLCLFVLIC